MANSLNTFPHVFHIPDLTKTSSGKKQFLIENFKKSLIAELTSKAQLIDKGTLVWNFIFQRYYSIYPFYHPFMTEVIQALYTKGIPGLLNRETQSLKASSSAILFNQTILERVDPNLATDSIDFSQKGAYSIYNWEIFFHAPFLIACQLNQNQKFEEAQKWFHFIFDPIHGSAPTDADRLASVWQTKPFFDAAKNKDFQKETATKLMLGVDSHVKELEDQVSEWRLNPFQPHLLARHRQSTYPKNVVMKYVNNLIDWGDSLFRQDTMESINEATLYYILAAKILGKKPQKVTALAEKPILTYNELKNQKIDSFGNALVFLTEAENLIPKKTRLAPSFLKTLPPLPSLALYFGIPQNDHLLQYWDRVADRLYKIRNGMNIDGVLRELNLFEPPIDPALLVKAAAKGLDIREVLSDLNTPTPIYRFSTIVQKTMELCNEVKSLGGALLSAIEKKDAEGLALLRSDHEIKLLKLVRVLKYQQIEEIKETIKGLEQSKASATERYNYYLNIERVSDKEQAAIKNMKEASDCQKKQSTYGLIASALAAIPDLKIGSPTTWGATVGQAHIAGIPRFASESYGADASSNNSQASIASTEAGHERRWDDWKLQERLAKIDMENFDRQIAAAQIRQAVAEGEMFNQDRQIEQAQEVNDYMHSKFTNEELYQWMKGQLSTLYFQVYKFAYDQAKRAQKVYNYELGLDSSDFIQSGGWDSLHSGLMAGERLSFDLKRLEMAYYENNKRDYEITKNISLAAFDGKALFNLRKTGQCRISLTEAMFDLDFPSHVMRRIKAMSLSLPCVVGPYTNMNCKLSLTKHAKRNEQGNLSSSGMGASVVISGAVNDSGLFEFNLRDERFLPFEGKGAISDWTIQLPDPNKAQFDYHTISDVIFHLRYIARDGMRSDTSTDSKPRTRLFSLKHEFSDVWQALLKSSDNKVSLILGPERFLYADRSQSYTITKENSVFYAEGEKGYQNIGFDITNNQIKFTGLAASKPKDIILIFTLKN